MQLVMIFDCGLVADDLHIRSGCLHHHVHCLLLEQNPNVVTGLTFSYQLSQVVLEAGSQRSARK